MSSIEGGSIGSAAIGGAPGALAAPGLVSGGEIEMMGQPSLGTATLDTAPKLDFRVYITPVGAITPSGSSESIPTPNVESAQALSATTMPRLQRFAELIVTPTLPALSRDRMMPKLEGPTISNEYSILALGKDMTEKPDSFQGTLIGKVAPALNEPEVEIIDTMMGTFLPDSPATILPLAESFDGIAEEENFSSDTPESDFSPDNSIDVAKAVGSIDTVAVHPAEGLLSSFLKPESAEEDGKERSEESAESVMTAEPLVISQVEAAADDALEQRVKDLMIQVGFAESEADTVVRQARVGKAERLGVVENSTETEMQPAKKKIKQTQKESAVLETAQAITANDTANATRSTVAPETNLILPLKQEQQLDMLEEALTEQVSAQNNEDETSKNDEVPIIARDIVEAREKLLINAAEKVAMKVNTVDGETEALEGAQIIEEAGDMNQDADLRSPIVEDGEDNTIDMIERDLRGTQIMINEIYSVTSAIVEAHPAIEIDKEPKKATPDQIAEVMAKAGTIINFGIKEKNRFLRKKAS